MRGLIFVILIIFTAVYWTEVSNFVSGNFSTIGNSAAKWLVDHTPKK
jgi:hypothetical protein